MYVSIALVCVCVCVNWSACGHVCKYSASVCVCVLNWSACGHVCKYSASVCVCVCVLVSLWPCTYDSAVGVSFISTGSGLNTISKLN